MKNHHLRILFIGNSHTYYNDLPELAAERFRREGYDCQVTMIAHGGWFLDQHVQEPDVRFNILYGQYDYVVLQEHAHPFGPEERFLEAVRQLGRWIRQAGSKPVIYMTWARKEEEQEQARMSRAHEIAAAEIQALLAPVGDRWWEYLHSHPGVEMYDNDGAHASAEGSAFAAECIFRVILKDLKKAFYDRYEFRQVRPGESHAAAEVEALSFPPEEACTPAIMETRVKLAPDLFLVAEEKSTGKIVGFITGIATEEDTLRDEFFTNTKCHDPNGAQAMILSLAVLPDYRGQGIASELVKLFLESQKKKKRIRAVLTCVPAKVEFYRNLGFSDRGESASVWGGERWNEMEYPFSY